MDELKVNQTKYISSKRASTVTGYAQDYVGQLIRQGKVHGERVGRSWYVSEEDIRRHADLLGDTKAAIEYVRKGVEELKAQNPVLSLSDVNESISRTWHEIKYEMDEAPIMPISDRRDSKVLSDITIKNKTFVISANVDGVITQQKSVKRIALPTVVQMARPHSQSTAVKVLSRTPIRAHANRNRLVLPQLHFGIVAYAVVASIFVLFVPIFG